MSSASYQQQWEVTDDIPTFYRRTGLISHSEDLEWLNIYLDNIGGVYNKSQVGVLIEFCKINPEYHIITSVNPGCLANRYVPGRKIYFLAHGDSNGNLVLNIFLKKSAVILTEEMFDEALAIVSDIDRRHKAE